MQWSDQLGDARLYHWMDAFGFGRRTGLGFPGEARGILPPLDDWSGVTSATVSFGQGIAVTPMQMLRAFSTIANGGMLVEPRLVLGTRDAAGAFHAAPASEPQRVVSEQTSTWLRSVLRSVVEEGTGVRADVAGLQIAGKTGTAWKPVEDTPALNADGEEDAYGEETGGIRYVATFAGFFPADHPELVVVVVLDEPHRPDYSGGRASAPAFAEFASFAARQLRINGVDEAVARTGERVRVLPEPEPAPPIIDLDGDGLDDSLGPPTTLAPS